MLLLFGLPSVCCVVFLIVVSVSCSLLRMVWFECVSCGLFVSFVFRACLFILFCGFVRLFLICCYWFECWFCVCVGFSARLVSFFVLRFFFFIFALCFWMCPSVCFRCSLFLMCVFACVCFVCALSVIVWFLMCGVCCLCLFRCLCVWFDLVCLVCMHGVFVLVAFVFCSYLLSFLFLVCVCSRLFVCFGL